MRNGQRQHALAWVLALGLSGLLATGSALAHSKGHKDHDGKEESHHWDDFGKGKEESHHWDDFGKGKGRDWDDILQPLPGVPGLPGRPCNLLPARIDPACKAQCDANERTCKAAAKQELNTCVNTNCGSALAVARSVCSSAPGSAECAAAWQAYVSCAQPCFSTYRTAHQTCDSDERACKAACPLQPVACTPTVDPLCIAQCRATQSTCSAAAQQDAVACYGGCQDLITEARTVCASGPTSADCQAALSALRACVSPCSLTLRQALEACKTVARTCTQSCTATLTPTPLP